MKHIFIVLMFVPSMLAAKAASPIAAAAPIKVAALRLDEEQSDSQLPESDLKIVSAEVKSDLKKLLQMLSEAKKAYDLNDIHSAEALGIKIKNLGATVLCSYQQGCLACDQTTPLMRALHKLCEAKSKAQQSAKSHSTR